MDEQQYKQNLRICNIKPRNYIIPPVLASGHSEPEPFFNWGFILVTTSKGINSVLKNSKWVGGQIIDK